MTDVLLYITTYHKYFKTLHLEQSITYTNCIYYHFDRRLSFRTDNLLGLKILAPIKKCDPNLSILRQISSTTTLLKVFKYSFNRQRIRFGNIVWPLTFVSEQYRNRLFHTGSPWRYRQALLMISLVQGPMLARKFTNFERHLQNLYSASKKLIKVFNDVTNTFLQIFVLG